MRGKWYTPHQKEVMTMPTLSCKEAGTEKHSGAYNGIDLVKFICAIMVFIMHVLPFRGEASGLAAVINYGLKNYLCRLAVPFYFVCSGFFLFRKMPRDALQVDVIKNYCFKMLRLAGTWYLLLIVGESSHLWFLGETVVAVVLVSLCLHRGMRLRSIWILAGCLYAIGLLGESYYGVMVLLEGIPGVHGLKMLFDRVLFITRNGVFFGFLFVLMGAAFAYHPVAMKPWKSFAGLSVSMVLLLGEAFVLKIFEIPREYSMYIFLLPAVYFLFAFAASWQLKDRPLYKRLRRIGLLLYLSHLMVTWAVDYLSNVVMGRSAPFLLALAAALAVAAGAEKLSEKKRFHWINWLLG